MLSEKYAITKHMIECQLRPNKITHHNLLEAMTNVPRDMFLPQSLKKRAYSDRAIPLSNSRHMLPPLLVATMIQSLNPQSDDFALVLASGYGYEAAILSHLVQTVIAQEHDAKYHKQSSIILENYHLENIITFHRPIDDPVDNQGVFDLILIVGGCVKLPDNVLNVLSPTGRLVYIDHHDNTDFGHAVLVENYHGTHTKHILCDATAPILPKCDVKKAFVF